MPDLIKPRPRFSFRALAAVGLIVFGVLLASIFRRGEVTGPPVAAKNVGPETAVIWEKWVGVGDGFLLVGGRRVAPGTALPNGAVLVSLSPDRRISLWQRRRDVFMWKFGDDAPKLLGDIAVVDAALRGAGSATSPAVDGPPSRAREAVEPAKGEPGLSGSPSSPRR